MRNKEKNDLLRGKKNVLEMHMWKVPYSTLVLFYGSLTPRDDRIHFHKILFIRSR